MEYAVGISNLILGVAYTSYGVLTAIEMKRGWRTDGFSHFGAAWIAMAFTCGPHHLEHGAHALADGRSGGLDFYAVLVGLPVGVTWMLLRMEAMFTRGRGDRFISGTPLWLKAMPTLIAVYLTTLVYGSLQAVDGPLRVSSLFTPNVLLLFIYAQIGYYLLRTQLRNHPSLGGWSVSGLCLSVIFPTCGIMHVIFALYTSTGFYHVDPHGFVVDWLSVPAGLYFLWVVQRLYRGELVDWNRRMSSGPVPAVAR